MLSIYVWLATVAVVTATVAPLARRRMVYERRRWIVLEALRKFNAPIRSSTVAHGPGPYPVGSPTKPSTGSWTRRGLAGDEPAQLP